jgi:hypothetical protein
LCRLAMNKHWVSRHDERRESLAGKHQMTRPVPARPNLGIPCRQPRNLVNSWTIQGGTWGRFGIMPPRQPDVPKRGLPWSGVNAGLLLEGPRSGSPSCLSCGFALTNSPNAACVDVRPMQDHGPWTIRRSEDRHAKTFTVLAIRPQMDAICVSLGGPGGRT